MAKRKVAHIPFYQHAPCLRDIRQPSLTKNGYRYDKRLQDQTQNTKRVKAILKSPFLGCKLNSSTIYRLKKNLYKG
jgi:hypothetical protein